ncbi:pre-mRNA-splicing factor rse1 [Puccinia graminis f. sp. tritici]|uniref:Pre-mRNA-splicing factor rse1 n=1 Tax=Puccinia graminis f. sp. tritici TaxID=56615 RepID=A0A5B0RQK9_PUCGR|nr:pre-mRNA-splicing factor rse1 [Puccinia graminis f. sp. tritici]
MVIPPDSRLQCPTAHSTLSLRNHASLQPHHLPPSAITCATVGSFSGTRQQDICVSRGGSRLELLRPDPTTGKLSSVVSTEVFGTIRALSSFRLTAGPRTTSSSPPTPAGSSSSNSTPPQTPSSNYIRRPMANPALGESSRPISGHRSKGKSRHDRRYREEQAGLHPQPRSIIFFLLPSPFPFLLTDRSID